MNVGNENELSGGGRDHGQDGDRGKECSPTTTVEAMAPETTTVTVAQPAGETGPVVTAGGILENETTAPLGVQSNPAPEVQAFEPENGGLRERPRGWLGLVAVVAVVIVSAS